MNDGQKIQDEASVLRWGSLSGILGSIVLLAVFVIVGVFVGADVANPFPSLPNLRRVHRVEPSEPLC